MTTRLAYVARHPILPGAMAYLNLEQVEAGKHVPFFNHWLGQGAIIAKVPLHQALDEFNQFIRATSDTPPTSTPDEDLPAFLKKQAD